MAGAVHSDLAKISENQRHSLEITVYSTKWKGFLKVCKSKRKWNTQENVNGHDTGFVK